MNQRDLWDVAQRKFEIHLKCTPFMGIKSRNATAIVLSFVGFRNEVMPLM